MKPSGEVFDRVWRARCRVLPITRAQGTPMIARHYLGKWPGVVTLTLGLFDGWDICGMCVFALPPRETEKRYGAKTWELARLWIDDKMPTNAESYFIAKCLGYVRKNRKDVSVIVSYADPSAGHSGTIYRASNWRQDGRTDGDRKTPRVDYVCRDTGKKFARRSHIPDGAPVSKVPRVSKFRFFYSLNGSAGGPV